MLEHATGTVSFFQAMAHSHRQRADGHLRLLLRKNSPEGGLPERKRVGLPICGRSFSSSCSCFTGSMPGAFIPSSDN